MQTFLPVTADYETAYKAQPYAVTNSIPGEQL
jgi:hypothetical protein